MTDIEQLAAACAKQQQSVEALTKSVESLGQSVAALAQATAMLLGEEAGRPVDGEHDDGIERDFDGNPIG